MVLAYLCFRTNCFKKISAPAIPETFHFSELERSYAYELKFFNFFNLVGLCNICYRRNIADIAF